MKDIYPRLLVIDINYIGKVKLVILVEGDPKTPNQ